MDEISFAVRCSGCGSVERVQLNAQDIVDLDCGQGFAYQCGACNTHWIELPDAENALEFLMRVGAVGTLRIPARD